VTAPRAAMEFTAEELDTLRVALLSAHYSALDEERHLRRLLDVGIHPGEESAERQRAEESRAKAALRAMAYHLLVERVMAERQKMPL